MCIRAQETQSRLHPACGNQTGAWLMGTVVLQKARGGVDTAAPQGNPLTLTSAGSELPQSFKKGRFGQRQR